jgi:hypothetical protein
MIAPALSIRRLSVSAHLPDGRRDQVTRIDRMLSELAGDRLERALRDAPLPPGTWCVRRLDVLVRLDLERADVTLAAAWAAALVGALRRALDGGSPEVVRYRRERDALVDLVCGAATGRLGRAWAWTRLGLLGPSDPPLERAPGQAVVAVLRRHPEQALGVVVSAARQVGLPALHLALGPAGWAALAAVVRSAVGGGMVRPPRATAAAPGRDHAGAGAALAGALVAASRLAGLLRDSRLRPDPGSLDAWALLVVAEADPSMLRRQVGGAAVTAVARALGGQAHQAHQARQARQARQAPPPAGAGAAAGRRPGRDPARPLRIGGHRGGPGPADGQGPEGEPARRLSPAPGAGEARRPGDQAPSSAPAPPDDGPWSRDDRDPVTHATEWAGLLFLLATAAEAGIPDAVVGNPVLAQRPLPWILQGIGLRLVPVDAADAALAAFAGVDPDDPPPWHSGPPASDEELAGLAAAAHRWAAVTAAALGEPDRDPLGVVASIARRSGSVEHAPGWLEIYLDLDQVDVAVRRAGLDLDPGWVPWLGTVVRFVYG